MIYLCPTEEDLGMLMSSVVVNVHMCGREEGKRGLGKGTRNGPVDSEHGASFFVQRATIPSKRVPFFKFINTTHANNIVYMLAMLSDKKYFLPSAG